MITFGIYPFVMGIIMCSSSNEFENKGFAIAYGILNILGFGFLLVTFIMGFFLKLKTRKE